MTDPAGDPRASAPDDALGPPRPTVPWHVATAVWALMAAPMSASPSPHLMLMVGALALGGMLGLIWSMQLLRVLLDRDARGRLTWRAAAGWAAYPATGFLLVALYSSQWPIALRVKLSEPALLRLVDEVEGGRATVNGRVGAGHVPVEWTSVEENCVLLCTGPGHFLTEHGLAYSRDGCRPSTRSGYAFRHLYGRWYTFTLHL